MQKTRVFTLVFVCALPASLAQAESWCADPLWVHEWGVQVFSGDAAHPAATPLPDYFHRATPLITAVADPVRALPVDGGERALPIVHLYAAGNWGDTAIPFALEVGFTEGEASAWFPQVDLRRSATDANSDVALNERATLVDARANRAPLVVHDTILPTDPTRQLSWEKLELTRTSAVSPATSHAIPWVDAVRAFDKALWVNRGGESERFIFYEAQTRESPSLAVERGDSWSTTRPHYVLRNTGKHDLHDVFVIRRDGNDKWVFSAPTIPAGATAAFLLDPPLDAPDFLAQTRTLLARTLTDATAPEPPEDYRWDLDNCVMGRDPALPVETSLGHRLYQAEVDVLLDVWGPRFFDAEGTTIVYREDTAYLDQVMPLSAYTDMYHFIQLQRAGLVVWENLDLETLSSTSPLPSETAAVPKSPQEESGSGRVGASGCQAAPMSGGAPLFRGASLCLLLGFSMAMRKRL